LITLDLPNGLLGADSYPWRANLVRSLGQARQKIHALRADSQRAETLARVRKLLSGEALDLLFIDGRDLREMPLADRKDRLKELLDAWHDNASPIRYVEHLTASGDEVLEAARHSARDGKTVRLDTAS
jgi:ATP-dependent DNA ligase